MNLPRAGSPALVAGWVCVLAACSPALNWRELPLPEGGAVAMFPCRPSHETREVELAGAKAQMSISACQAGGAMYAVSRANVGDPARVGAALQALREAAADNLRAQVSSQRPVQVEGMTPHPQARLLELAGRLPDGRDVQERVAVFSKGTVVFQATMFGAKLGAEASETFFGGIRLP